jgi:hypothetical protein
MVQQIGDSLFKIYFTSFQSSPQGLFTVLNNQLIPSSLVLTILRNKIDELPELTILPRKIKK